MRMAAFLLAFLAASTSAAPWYAGIPSVKVLSPGNETNQQVRAAYALKSFAPSRIWIRSQQQHTPPLHIVIAPAACAVRCVCCSLHHRNSSLRRFRVLQVVTQIYSTQKTGQFNSERFAVLLLGLPSALAQLTPMTRDM